jgi:hypothetical protein
VGLAGELGVLVVVLLWLLIAWQRLSAPADDEGQVGPAQPGPHRSRIILLT